MNLADWLQGDHEPSERLKAVESVCRAVSEHSSPGALALDPARIHVSANGECRPEEGKGAPTGRYRAPEVAEGKPAVPQSHVYTVGVLCYEILAGRNFEARGGPLLRDVRPQLPRDLSDAVQACLEMDPEWRPKDLSYLHGLAAALVAPGPAATKTAARGGRPATSAPSTPRSARRSGPAPRPWPLLAFALVALAVSLVTAVVRLRQPIEPPSLPPAPPSIAPLRSPEARDAASGGPVAPALPSRPPSGPPLPGDATRRPAVATAPSVPPGGVGPAASPVASRPTRAASPGAVAASPGRAATPPPAAADTPAPPAVVAATPPPPANGPVSTAPAEPAGPAAVTNVSPPLLRRGATVLVDVHGVGLRSDHRVRLAHGKEAARGIEVMRQRYVGPTLLQVLLKVDASAPTGAYTLLVVDGAGNSTNARPFEIAK